jgi:spore germination cell wall hydrolase CwlJ-like protein
VAVGIVVMLIIGAAYLVGYGVWSPEAGGRRIAKHPHAPNAVAQAMPPTVAPQVFEKVTPDQAVLLNAQIPISSLPNPAAAPFVLNASPAEHARAQSCLAMAVYYEAGNQGADGEAAVAQVVLNRVRNPIFPKSVCGVVFQGSERSTGCQFTFTCDGSLNRRPSPAAWRDANDVAARALNGYVQKAVGDATHYHTIWVVPYWQTTVVKVAELGAHIFYRWQGAYGPGAFSSQYAGSEMAVPLPATLTNSDLIDRPLIQVAKVEAQVAEIHPSPAPVIAVLAVAQHAAGSPAPEASLTAAALPMDLAQQPAPTLFSNDSHPAPHLPMR